MTNELAYARDKHGPIRTLHDAYGVIQEEFDEWFDEVKKQNPGRARLLAELVSVAAMCQRAAEDLHLIEDYPESDAKSSASDRTPSAS